MARNLVAVGRLAVNGTHRAEVGSWLVEVVSVSMSDPEVRPLIDDVLHVPVSQFPTDVARNKLVRLCQDRHVDIVFMVDDDMGPPEGWFRCAFMFLANHQGPAVIGCPYVCGGIHEEVQAFEWASPNNDAQRSFSLCHIPREDAARRTGIQRIANLGTGCLAYRMDAFDTIDRPYYSYDYDEDHTRVLGTEDVVCHRKMHVAGVPLYVAWTDHQGRSMWSDHYKVSRLTKPYVLQDKDIEQTYMAQAASLLRTTGGPGPCADSPVTPVNTCHEG